MSSLKTIDKAQLEELLEMGGGYVLDFSDRSFAEFFRDDVGVEIDDPKYCINGGSKARRLRVFWDIENDDLVGRALAELIKYWRFRNPTPSVGEVGAATGCEHIVERLLNQLGGKPDTQAQFLSRDLRKAAISSVDLDDAIKRILEARFSEAERCLENGLAMSCIFMAGSVLEGLLLGTACANPKLFNQSSCSPKDFETGKVKLFRDWKLAEFIDVACDLGFVRLDVKKFSHELRDFRNFIHPYQQLATGFTPDDHTAEICMQVLRAAVASLANERNDL